MSNLKQGDKIEFRGHAATVQLVFEDGLTQFAYQDDDGIVIVRAYLPACDCAATTEGKWADVHHSGCAIFKAA